MRHRPSSVFTGLDRIVFPLCSSLDPSPLPAFSVKSPLRSRFSFSSSFTRASRTLTFSVISFASFSIACSRCFFLTRKRALAAVLRRLLSSSALTLKSSLTFSFDVSPSVLSSIVILRLLLVLEVAEGLLAVGPVVTGPVVVVGLFTKVDCCCILGPYGPEEAEKLSMGDVGKLAILEKSWDPPNSSS